MRHKLAVALVIASTVCTTCAASAAEETQAATFSLSNAATPQAATVLRTIVGIKDLKIDDDHTITVRDTREKVELAEAVVKLLDAADDAVDTTPLPASDGSVIVAVVLKGASSGEVILALQQELQFARSAGAGEKRVILRDTDGQVMKALKVIERLERSHASS